MGKDSFVRQPKGKLLSFIPTGEYYFSKGIKAYHRRDFHKSKKYLQRAMHLEPNEPMIICQLAIVCTEMGEYQHSNRLLHMILEEIDSDMVECHYFLANNYAHIGYFKDAHHHATLYIDLNIDGEFIEDAEDLLDLLSLEQEDFEEGFFEEDDLIIKQEKATDLIENRQFSEAVVLLKEVIEQYPEYWSAYNNLALAYYHLDEKQKAYEILESVLELNPGNLHALCNKLLFAFAENRYEEVASLKVALRKIKPLLADHQLKLGTTLAVVGDYETALLWLRRLQKSGYHGDWGFYYYLALSSYFTGREQMAKLLWKKVVELKPEQEGNEPWAEEAEATSSHFLKKMKSDLAIERLVGLFLAVEAGHKAKALEVYPKSGNITMLERQYLEGTATTLQFAFDIAKRLQKENEESILYTWFSVFLEMANQEQQWNNPSAWAAATEYVWSKSEHVKQTQQTVAAKFGISTSTLQKYVKMVNKHL
jgi:tetratricopeptide (TPR) repeat protein